MVDTTRLVRKDSLGPLEGRQVLLLHWAGILLGVFGVLGAVATYLAILTNYDVADSVYVGIIFVAACAGATLTILTTERRGDQ